MAWMSVNSWKKKYLKGPKAKKRTAAPPCPDEVPPEPVVRTKSLGRRK